MVDHVFSDSATAELYDVFHPWGLAPDDAFYIDLVMAARSVLDVGCGTGLLQRAARERGHTGRLVGLDPAAAMLEVGRRDRDDVEWTLGDLVTTPFEDEFDLVVMTGHAFQVFTTDEELRAALAAVRRALTGDGRFVFETRNPAARGWEAWRPSRTRTVTGPDGVGATSVHRLESVEGDLVTFTAAYSSTAWGGAVRHSRSTLRFLDADTLNAFLAGAGLEVRAQYGDWERGPLTDTAEEIITFARPGRRACPGPRRAGR
ncbi:class I SAM-dependent methyltransferase [Nocardiopsis sp. CT-R113]|uniref:Class I SAM-dependent methyltransferase n=1 Tax=Nocardiopsis codii TaxID=3065942 RepID=A0ABU7K5B0_9ACTN|nr:class I SAM-dependent methyltransferase [Nocardiopsis sp. CT-R113]MEE2037034.1 class I SAM-dependent methyltransferase [Nocardiopsis sp. CT-R113]